MSRYVDTDKVYETARKYHKDFTQSIADLTSLHEVLADTPSADVVEVKHGYWKGIGRCSICEAFSLSSGTDYCPNCGAKMDEERKDEE